MSSYAFPVLQQLELLSPFQLYFNPHLVFRKFQVRRPDPGTCQPGPGPPAPHLTSTPTSLQVWRLITTFLFFGPLGFGFFFNMLFVYPGPRGWGGAVRSAWGRVLG